MPTRAGCCGPWWCCQPALPGTSPAPDRCPSPPLPPARPPCRPGPWRPDSLEPVLSGQGQPGVWSLLPRKQRSSKLARKVLGKMGQPLWGSAQAGPQMPVSGVTKLPGCPATQAPHVVPPIKASSGVWFLGTGSVAHLYPALTVHPQQGSMRAQGPGHPSEVGAGWRARPCCTPGGWRTLGIFVLPASLGTHSER